MCILHILSGTILTLKKNVYKNVKPLQTSSTTSDPEGHWDMNNCRELLAGKLQVHWEVQGDWVQVQLTGKIREDQYMAFGLSGNQKR